MCFAVTRTRSVPPWRPLMQVLLSFKLIVTDRLTARQQVLIPDIGQLPPAETDIVKILNFRRTGPFPPCHGSTEARAYRQVCSFLRHDGTLPKGHRRTARARDEVRSGSTRDDRSVGARATFSTH